MTRTEKNDLDPKNWQWPKKLTMTCEMDECPIYQYCPKIFTLSAQGDRGSRPSTGAPSREISVQNLSNPALGSPTKVRKWLRKPWSFQDMFVRPGKIKNPFKPLWPRFVQETLIFWATFAKVGLQRPWPKDRSDDPQTWTITPLALTKTSHVVPANFVGIPKYVAN